MPIGIYDRKKAKLNKGWFEKGCTSWNKGKHWSKETIEKMSKAKKGQKGYWQNKKLSKKHRENISKSRIGKFCREKTWNWKGGRKKSRGYIYILKPNHPFANPAGYVAEHRFIIEQFIKRYLTSKECGHHINGIKYDNRPKNLMAFKSNAIHHHFHKNPNFVKPSEIIFNGEI